MGRFRQVSPRSYGSSSNIDAEFQNVARYLTAAELGNKTIGELLATIFDEDGEFDGGPIAFRFDASDGLEYRIGEYDSDDEGWVQIADAADLVGPAGTTLATIEGPLFFNRQDYTATGGQTVFSHTLNTNASTVVVYVNGLLRPTADYSVSSTAVTFGAGLSLSDKVTIYDIRSSAVSGYRRQDTTIGGTTTVVNFVHTSDETLLVWKNGALKIGGGVDYSNSPTLGQVIFTSNLVVSDKVTIVTAENAALEYVQGLMTLAAFCNSANAILYNKLAIADDEIPQSKVDGLADELASKGTLTVAATAPVSPSTGDLWVDTAADPVALKYWDGTQWLTTQSTETDASGSLLKANNLSDLPSKTTARQNLGVIFNERLSTPKTGAYSVVSTDVGKLIPVDATSAPFTVALGAASTLGNGFIVGFIKTDNTYNGVTIDASGSETINGVLNYLLTDQYELVWLMCNGTSWEIVGHVAGQGLKDGVIIDRREISVATAAADFFKGWSTAQPFGRMEFQITSFSPSAGDGVAFRESVDGSTFLSAANHKYIGMTATITAPTPAGSSAGGGTLFPISTNIEFGGAYRGEGTLTIFSPSYPTSGQRRRWRSHFNAATVADGETYRLNHGQFDASDSPILGIRIMTVAGSNFTATIIQRGYR